MPKQQTPDIDIYADIKDSPSGQAQPLTDFTAAPGGLMVPKTDPRTAADYREEQLDIETALEGDTANRRTSGDLPDAPRVAGELSSADLSRVAQAVGLDIDGGSAHLVQTLRRETEQLGMTIARIGVGLTALKARLGHGEFEAAVEEIGLAPQRARECMQVARFLAAQPPARLQRFAELPKSKVLELAKAEPEVLDEYLSGEDGEAEAGELEALSVRELRLRLRELKEEREELANQLEAAGFDNERLQSELKAAGYERYKQAINNVSPDFLEIREESAVAGDLMVAAINNLRRLYDQRLGAHAELFSQPPNPRAYLDDDGQVRTRRTAAVTLYHNLAGALSHGLALMRELEQAYLDAIGEPVFGHHYSEDELALFQETRERMLSTDAAGRKLRADERHNKATKGMRGRPRGTGKQGSEV